MKKTVLSISLFFGAACVMQAQLIMKPYQGTVPGGVVNALPILQNNSGKSLASDDLAYTQFDTLSHYVITPISQVQPLHFGGTIKNNGTDTATNVAMTIDVKNYANVSVYNANGNITDTLLPGASFNTNVNGYTPTIPDLYTIRFGTTMDQTDADTTNNVYFGSVLISDTTYSRDNGQVTGALGIGAGTGGFIGQHFEVFNTAQATSVSFFVTKGYAGKKAAAVIWDFANGLPNAIVAGTDTMLYPDDSARFYTLPLTQNKILTPGKYAVTLIEFDSTLNIGTTTNFFENKATWIKWPGSPGGGWVNNELFNFKVVYVVRLNLDIYTGITKREQNISAIAYPNPAKDVLNISLTGIAKSNATIQLFDNKGSLVYNEALTLMNDQQHQISTAHLSNGIYVLKVITPEGVSINKITKNN